MKTILFPALALALTAAPIIPAMAAQPSGNVVRFNDLDLDSEAGKAELDGRIRAVARRICVAQPQTGSRLASKSCIDDIRQQVLAQVEAKQTRTGKGG